MIAGQVKSTPCVVSSRLIKYVVQLYGTMAICCMESSKMNPVSSEKMPPSGALLVLNLEEHWRGRKCTR